MFVFYTDVLTSILGEKEMQVGAINSLNFKGFTDERPSERNEDFTNYLELDDDEFVSLKSQSNRIKSETPVPQEKNLALEPVNYKKHLTPKERFNAFEKTKKDIMQKVSNGTVFAGLATGLAVYKGGHKIGGIVTNLAAKGVGAISGSVGKIFTKGAESISNPTKLTEKIGNSLNNFKNKCNSFTKVSDESVVINSKEKAYNKIQGFFADVFSESKKIAEPSNSKIKTKASEKIADFVVNTLDIHDKKSALTGVVGAGAGLLSMDLTTDSIQKIQNEEQLKESVKNIFNSDVE